MKIERVGAVLAAGFAFASATLAFLCCGTPAPPAPRSPPPSVSTDPLPFISITDGGLPVFPDLYTCSVTYYPPDPGLGAIPDVPCVGWEHITDPGFVTLDKNGRGVIRVPGLFDPIYETTGAVAFIRAQSGTHVSDAVTFGSRFDWSQVRSHPVTFTFRSKDHDRNLPPRLKRRLRFQILKPSRWKDLATVVLESGFEDPEGARLAITWWSYGQRWDGDDDGVSQRILTGYAVCPLRRVVVVACDPRGACASDSISFAVGVKDGPPGTRSASGEIPEDLFQKLTAAYPRLSASKGRDGGAGPASTDARQSAQAQPREDAGKPQTSARKSRDGGTDPTSADAQRRPQR